MQLSKHFKLEEMTKSMTATRKGIDNSPGSGDIKNLDRITKHIEDMALNKVNIEFLRKQMDKVLEDIEKLKDANRDMKYTNGGHQ